MGGRRSIKKNVETEQALADIEGLVPSAVSQLGSLLADKDTPAGVREKAVRTILEAANVIKPPDTADDLDALTHAELVELTVTSLENLVGECVGRGLEGEHPPDETPPSEDGNRGREDVPLVAPARQDVRSA